MKVELCETCPNLGGGVVNFQRFVIADKVRGDQSEGWGMGEWVMCSQLLESSKVVFSGILWPMPQLWQ